MLPGSAAEHRAGTTTGEDATVPSVRIRNGHAEWEEFCEASDFQYYHDGVVALFDQHHVIDTLSYEEAGATGVQLDHLNGVTVLRCSKARSHRQSAFDQYARWWPMANECEGHIFTDYDKGYHRTVDIYRESWMQPNCICVRGDKGQAASLLGLPCILFDDKEDNVRSLRRRSTPTTPLDGIIVRRGRLVSEWVEPGFLASSDCAEWPGLVKHFRDNRQVSKRQVANRMRTPPHLQSDDNYRFWTGERFSKWRQRENDAYN